MTGRRHAGPPVVLVLCAAGGREQTRRKGLRHDTCKFKRRKMVKSSLSALMAVAVMLRPSEALPMSPSSFSAPSRVAKSAAVQVQQHHGRYVSRASSRPDVFHHLSHQYHTYQHQHRSYTALYSSGESQLESPDEGNDDKSPKKWQQPIQSMKRIILAFLKFFINAPKQFNLYYSKLSKKGKIILGVQLLALGMVFGMGIKSSSDARARHANRPVEVGYSTFLDLVDINGKVSLFAVSCKMYGALCTAAHFTNRRNDGI